MTTPLRTAARRILGVDARLPASRVMTEREAANNVRDGHLVSLLDATSIEAEQYRILRHSIEERWKGALGGRVLAITSPGPGDGKTLTTVNLAGALAQARGSRVLMIEADLRLPTMLEKLGLERSDEPGLVEAVLDDDLTLAQIARQIPGFNLMIVPAGRAVSAPYEILNSSRLAELVQAAREAYHFVLIDTPPAVACPDYQLLERLADASLLVVMAHRTPRELLKACLGVLDASKTLGLVFNGDNPRLQRYYSAYYRHTYKRGASKP